MPRPPESMNDPEFGRRVPEPSADPQIPTLDAVAVPHNDPPFNHATFESVLIGSERHGLSMASPPPETQLSAADIELIVDKLRRVLVPEIEKAASFAMNHAFALAMDQASHVMRHKIHDKLEALLPKLVEDAIRDPRRTS